MGSVVADTRRAHYNVYGVGFRKWVTSRTPMYPAHSVWAAKNVGSK